MNTYLIAWPETPKQHALVEELKAALNANDITQADKCAKALGPMACSIKQVAWETMLLVAKEVASYVSETMRTVHGLVSVDLENNYGDHEYFIYHVESFVEDFSERPESWLKSGSDQGPTYWGEGLIYTLEIMLNHHKLRNKALAEVTKRHTEIECYPGFDIHWTKVSELGAHALTPISRGELRATIAKYLKFVSAIPAEFTIYREEYVD